MFYPLFRRNNSKESITLTGMKKCSIDLGGTNLTSFFELPEIVPNKLGDSSGVFGAVSLALSA